MTFTATPPLDRFLAKVQRDPGSGCWRFNAAPGRGGYMQFRPGGSAPKVAAHRRSYEYFVGPIPEGLQLDHLCGVPCCVNPTHLDPVTAQVNTIRAKRLINKCRQGHPFTPDTLHIDARGWRSCRPCRQGAARRYYLANRAPGVNVHMDLGLFGGSGTS